MCEKVKKRKESKTGGVVQFSMLSYQVGLEINQMGFPTVLRHETIARINAVIQDTVITEKIECEQY